MCVRMLIDRCEDVGLVSATWPATYRHLHATSSRHLHTWTFHFSQAPNACVMYYKRNFCFFLVINKSFTFLCIPYIMSSDSDDHSTANSVRCRRYRQRRQAGVPPEHRSTPDEQRRLLSLPYNTLTPKQKSRVRYYRRQHHIQQQHEQSLQPQSDAHVQQHAQLVASRFTNTSFTTTTSPVMLSPPMDMSSYQPLTGVNLMPSPSSIPPFIPVAMVPSSYFPTMFPHVTTPSTIPVVLSSHTQPIQPTVVHHVQPVTASLSIMNQSDVDSPPVSQTPHQPSVTSSEMSSTPAKILVGMTGRDQTTTVSHGMVDATTSQPIQSTITPGKSLPTVTTSSITTTSSVLPLDDVIHMSAYLVRSYEQVMSQVQHKQQHYVPRPCEQPLPTPVSQLRPSYHHIYDHILKPHKRYEHMIDAGEKPGRYLSVIDMDIKQDIHPNPHNNIIQEMLMKTTSSSSSTAQQLKQVLSLSTHPSYSQQSIPSSQSPPSLQLITLKQHEAYERLVHASTSSTITPNKHIFTPSININCVKDPIIRQRLIDIARAAQQQYKQQTPHKHQEVECDDVFTSPLDGFGVSGLQVYIKSGESVTWLHDELLWCAALNYMLKESQGCALWIAVGLHDLKQVMSLNEVEKLFLSGPTKRNVLEVGTSLDTLIASGAYMEYAFQYPGTLISSPPGNGAAHFVYSHGTLMTQIAWDYSFTIPGAVQCLSYWGIDDNHDHLAIGNTSMSNISVVPLYTMQLQGYELGLMDRINHYKQLIIKLQSIKPKTKVTHTPSLAGIYCPDCLYRQDWIRVNNQCIHCYFKKPTVLKLLQ